MNPARRTDPFTSWAAGYQAQEKAAGVRNVILNALQVFGPLTHEDLVDAVNRVQPASPSGVRTRTKELVRDGLVRPYAGMVSKSRLGRASLLWEAVPQ